MCQILDIENPATSTSMVRETLKLFDPKTGKPTYIETMADFSKFIYSDKVDNIYIGKKRTTIQPRLQSHIDLTISVVIPCLVDFICSFFEAHSSQNVPDYFGIHFQFKVKQFKVIYSKEIT